MKNIIVFGGSGGVGSQLIPLLKEKYNVVSLSSKDVDVTNFKQVKDFFDLYVADVVLNFSGLKYDAYLSKISESDIEEIEKMIDVNVLGNVNILAGCLPHMREKGWGRVILISSVFSEMNVPKNSVYCASKAFVDRLAQNANKESIRAGVTCNSIQLGFWDGGMCYRVPADIQERAKNKIGLKRWGSIEELYNTIEFIIENEYVAGTNLRIDGGL